MQIPNLHTRFCGTSFCVPETWLLAALGQRRRGPAPTATVGRANLYVSERAAWTTIRTLSELVSENIPRKLRQWYPGFIRVSNNIITGSLIQRFFEVWLGLLLVSHKFMVIIMIWSNNHRIKTKLFHNYSMIIWWLFDWLVIWLITSIWLIIMICQCHWQCQWFADANQLEVTVT